MRNHKKNNNWKKYHNYLNSDQWKNTKYRKLLSEATCEKCGKKGTKKNPIEIHHKKYNPREEEKLEDLMILCRRHHLMEELKKVTTTGQKIKEILLGREY